MKAPRPRETGKPALDRFGTHRVFCTEHVAGLTKKTRSTAAGLALLVVWDCANGKTGLVHGLSVTRLSKLMGTDPKTARSVLRVLVTNGFLRVAKAAVVPVYELTHVDKATSGGGPEHDA